MTIQQARITLASLYTEFYGTPCPSTLKYDSLFEYEIAINLLRSAISSKTNA